MESGKTVDNLSTGMSTELTVTDMTCGGCESSVEAALKKVDGVTSVDADHESNRVVVEGDADTDELVAAVDDAGFQASA